MAAEPAATLRGVERGVEWGTGDAGVGPGIPGGMAGERIGYTVDELLALTGLDTGAT